MTSVTVKSGVARHGRALVSIVLFQTLLIFWLSFWAVEDYLNNVYVRAYVDGTIQVEGWLFGLVAFVGVLGSVTGLVVRRKHSMRSLETISTGVKTAGPISPGFRAPAFGSASVSTKPAIAAVANSKPSVELHPAVAALKAELSEARMSLGLQTVATTPEKLVGPTARFEDQRTNVGSQPGPAMRPPMMGPRPQLSVMGPTPQTVIRPGPSQMSNRPLPPTVIRPMAPLPSGAAPFPRPVPVLKIEGSTPPVHVQAPIGTVPRPEPLAAAPKDASTVITGIMAVQQQKKKDEPGSSNGQDTDQQ